MIPLSLPHIAGNEWKYVKECLDTGWVSSAGAYVNRFEQMVAEYAGTQYGVACMNGTSGLHLSLHLLGVEPGDLIIVPNITFIASVNAIKYTGASPLLIDVDPGSWQMDLTLLQQFLAEETITKERATYLKSNGGRIAAIMPVHVLGNMGDMEVLQSIASQYHLPIVEDSTEALGSYSQGRHAGSFGKMGVFSFNGNKIISTGGGGVIVTDDENLATQAKHLSTQAKAKPEEYFHDSIGFNYRLVNVLAAIGVAQMEQLTGFIQKKKRMDAFYRENLSHLPGIEFQKIRKEVDPNCWLFTFAIPEKQALINYLNENGVMCRPFWVPMNQLPMFRDEHYVSKEDHSAQVYDSCLSIPSSVNLTDEQMETVVNTIHQFYQ